MAPFQVPEGPFSIEQVMAAIREQVVKPSGASNAAAPRLVPAAASPASPAPAIAASESLRESVAQLARRQETRPDYSIRSHRPLLRILIDPVKRAIHWGARPYADRVREKQEAFNAATLETFRRLLDRLNAVDEALARAGERSARIEARVRRLEKLDSGEDFYAHVDPEMRMTAMDVNRGRYDDIHMRQKKYLDYFRDLPGPVLDVGCGRGELLTMLRNEGIECWGADLDPLMVRATQASGVHAVEADGLTALNSAVPASLGGLFAAQVVEHLHPGELFELLLSARRQLAPGGVMVLETLNPASLAVLAKSYFRDLDHKQPIHPEHLKQIVELAGFEKVELQYLHPFSEDERPPALPSPSESGLPPQAHAALIRRFEKIDALLYGMQDYCVIARQGATPLPVSVAGA